MNYPADEPGATFDVGPAGGESFTAEYETHQVRRFVDMEESHLQKIIRNRRSIRRYSDRPVERDKILACLEAARLAPSAQNVQPWRFLVVDDPEVKARTAEAAFSGIFSSSRFVEQAPVIVVMLDRPDFVAGVLGRRVRNVPFDMIDMGIAGEQFVLQAEELGLATCWIGWFNEKKLRKILAIPKKYKIVAMMPLGYAETRPSHSPSKRSMEEMAWFNSMKEEPGEGPKA